MGGGWGNYLLPFIVPSSSKAFIFSLSSGCVRRHRCALSIILEPVVIIICQMFSCILYIYIWEIFFFLFHFLGFFHTYFNFQILGMRENLHLHFFFKINSFEHEISCNSINHVTFSTFWPLTHDFFVYSIFSLRLTIEKVKKN